MSSPRSIPSSCHTAVPCRLSRQSAKDAFPPPPGGSSVLHGHSLPVWDTFALRSDVRALLPASFWEGCGSSCPLRRVISRRCWTLWVMRSLSLKSLTGDMITQVLPAESSWTESLIHSQGPGGTQERTKLPVTTNTAAAAELALSFVLLRVTRQVPCDRRLPRDACPHSHLNRAGWVWTMKSPLH